MKQPQKRAQILLAVALLLYACGYVTQFIGNYAVWQKNGGMLGGTSPPFPSLSPLTCLKGVLWFPYNLYCMKPNTKYCTGGKKVIIFRSDDPKVNVPKWCPKLRVPPTLRINAKFERWRSTQYKISAISRVINSVSSVVGFGAFLCP